jgi:endonuclease/exonuclease/phosphatase family metal-dependent hydrolase
MEKGLKKWGRRILIWSNLGIVFFYLLVCLIPFLDAGKFWFIAMLGLIFPVLLVCNVLFLFVWFIKRSRWVFLSLTSLLLGWQQVSVLFGVHFFQKEFVAEKNEKTLRVLSWNVARWDEQNKHAKGGVSYRSLMMDMIRMQNADVLCLQEFFEPRSNTVFDKNIDALIAMGYTYNYFFPSSIIWEGELMFGLIISSRYPIVDSAQFSFGQTPHSEGLIYADIRVQNKTIRVFSVHMESSRISNSGYFDGKAREASLTRARQAVGSLKTAYQYRGVQAEIVKEQIDASPYPVILCGNLGDIPNSHSYFTVRGSLQDAFLKKGAGLGRTFRFVSPTLRIEYILADKNFTVTQYSRPKVIYSDHYPLIADLE